jgi:hypothetical protein
MFRFTRNEQKAARRDARARELAEQAGRTDDKLPERPSLDGYLVYELPDGLADLLVKAFRRRSG